MQCCAAIFKETLQGAEPKENFSVQSTHIQNMLTDTNNKKVNFFFLTIPQFTVLL